MKATIACVGDSQTDNNAGFGVDAWNTWPVVLAKLLNAEGCSTRARSFGYGGYTSTQLLARADQFGFYDLASMAVLYFGVNDPSGSINQATTQANLQATIKSAKHGAIGAGYGNGATVAGQANLPSNGELGQRYVVLSDTSTTGGAAAWHASQTATISGSSASTQSVWEYRYPLAGEAGWGRVATDGTPPSGPNSISRIAVVTANYLNWTTGGDTLTTPYATYAPVRAAQVAAVTAEAVSVGGVPTVVLVDLYNFQRSRIVAGTDPNFAGGTYVQATSWHVADANQHHDAYGHALVAQAIRQAMPAAWVTALI